MLALTRADICDEPFPVAAFFVYVIKHRKQDDTFDVNIGATSPADDVLELGNFYQLAVAVKRVHYYSRGRQVETLREGRRRDRYFEDVIAQQALHLLAVCGRQRTVMQRDAQAKAFEN